MTDRHGERRDHPIDDVAPTLTSKARSDSWVLDRRTNSKKGRGGFAPTAPVEVSRPSPTLTSKTGGQWILTRPATTIVGSFRPDIVAAPGYRTTGSRQYAEGSIAITIEEALVLQSFRADYPVAGSKSAKFLQVGNAVPPVLAAAVLRGLL